MKFKEKVIKAIHKQGYTITEASKLLKVDRTTIYRWLNNPGIIPVSFIPKISGITQISEIKLLRLINN